MLAADGVWRAVAGALIPGLLLTTHHPTDGPWYDIYKQHVEYNSKLHYRVHSTRNAEITDAVMNNPQSRQHGL